LPELEAIFQAWTASGGPDLAPLALAWARALPIVTIVPAFGLAAVALPIRVALAVALAAAAAPGLRPLALDGTPFVVALAREALVGLPVALGAAALLWAAVMAGGLVDTLRGAREAGELPLLDEPGTPLSALFGMLAAIAFLEVGGAARVAAALSDPGLATPWAEVAARLAASLGIAVAIAAPLVAASLLIEIAGALIARAASPAFVMPLLMPLRSMAVLAVLWVSFDRIAELLVLLATTSAG